MTLSQVKARKCARFLAALEQCGNVSEAARRSGLARQRAYEFRRSDPEFAAAWAEALDDAIDRLAMEARRRAVDGEPRPVVYRGQVVGLSRHYSDRLLMFLLGAHRPELYRANYRAAAEAKPEAESLPLALPPQKPMRLRATGASCRELPCTDSLSPLPLPACFSPVPPGLITSAAARPSTRAISSGR